MTTLKDERAPVLLGGPAGASEAVESYREDSLNLIITRDVLPGNPQFHDSIVEAIRVLARRGRMLREQQEAAATTHDDGVRQEGIAGADELGDQATPAAGAIGENTNRASSLGAHFRFPGVEGRDGR